MLIQLVDPSSPRTTIPPQKGPAIGIDLGTTHSVVAVCEDNQARVLTTADGKSLIPSVVAYENGIALVGAAAQERENSIASIKRLMGVNHGSVGQSLKNPIQISADILKEIKRIAENALGDHISQAVITVPAYFDEGARQETKEAAKLAGLTVLRLINEPTAAALAYGLDQNVEGIYAVYDFGGGTFDISIIHFRKGVFQVIATAGDTRLGGDDIDQLLAERLKIPLPKARALKELLSYNQSSVPLDFSYEDFSGLVQPIITRTLDICSMALADARLKLADLKGVILVGGSTRMPLVRQAVEDYFGQVPLTNLNPDEVVALGAARQAQALTRGADTLLLDVTPLSLGIETLGGIVEKIIHRNTPIPVAIAQEFTTYEEGQNALIVHVVQGEREFVKDCRSLATFTLTGIPPMAAGIARIRITFALDVDGLLTVTAKEMATGVSQNVEIQPNYGLKDEDLFEILRDNYEHGAEDIMHRLLIEAKLETEQFITMLTPALAEDGDLLESSERTAIDAALEELRKSLSFDNKDAIKSQLRAIESLTQDFAERRIDRDMRRALSGQRVDTV